MSTSLVIVAPPLLCEAWRALLAGQPDIVIARTTGTPDALPVLTPPGEVTTVLLHQSSPDPAAVRQVRARIPDGGLLVLVPAYDLDGIVSLLQSGVTGVLSQQETAGELVRAVIAVGRGEIVLPPAIASRALGVLAGGERGAGALIEPLSDRETEVLALLARGLTNKDIAQTLMLSVRTVEAHLRSIYGKLEVRSRTEAVLWAIRHGEVEA